MRAIPRMREKPMRARTKKIIVMVPLLSAISLAAFVAYGLVFQDSHWLEEVLGGYFWDGEFTLNVRIESRSSNPIKHLSYTFVSQRQEVDLLSQMQNDLDYNFRAAEDFDGGNFVAKVPCSGCSWLGVGYGYVEPYRFMVVRVDCGDAKPLRYGAEIPSGRGPRSLTVKIP
jgi:hypothetical protein